MSIRRFCRDRMSAAVGVLILLFFAGLGCGPDRTAIRRSAFIPDAYLPARTGPPLERGEMRVSGEISGAPFGSYQAAAATLACITIVGCVYLDRSGREGDPGVFIPRFHLGFSYYSHVVAGLELGGQFRYASYGWASANRDGVLPLVDSMSKDLFSGGIGVRYNFVIKKIFSISLITEFNLAGINQATYLLDGRDSYRFYKSVHETFLLPATYVTFGVNAFRLFSFHLLGGVQRNLKNIGFDNKFARRDEDTLRDMGVGLIGIGAEFHHRRIAIGINAYFPITLEPTIDFGPNLSLTLGGRINALRR